MGAILPQGKTQFFNTVAAGAAPLSGGSVTFYARGTTTYQNTYQDINLTVVNTNPVILNANGEAQIWGTGAYTVVVNDEFGNQIYSADTQAPLGNSTDISTALGFTPANAATLSALQTTVAAIPAATTTTIANIAALRALTGTTGGAAAPVVFVEGYLTNTDGGGGIFVFAPSDTSSTDNGGTIIVDGVGHRYYRSGIKGTLNIAWFGGTPGASDNTTALNSALTALPSSGGIIYFGSGTFTFLSEITFNYATAGTQSVSIIGSGSGNTLLSWTSTSGLSWTLNNQRHSFHFQDLTFSTTSTNLYTAVTVTQTQPGGAFDQNDFTRVIFRGPDNANSECWAQDISVIGICGINYDGCDFFGSGVNGNGVSLLGNTTASFQYSLTHNFTKCSFYSGDIAFSYGSYVQGVTFSQCSFVNCALPVDVPNNGVGLSELIFTSCLFNGTGNQILVSSPIGEVQWIGNLFIVPENAAAIVAAATISFFTFIGNVLNANSATGTNGFFAENSVTAAGVITGNNFSSFGVGVYLGSSTNNINVQANNYPNCTTKYVNSGTDNNIGVASP